MKKVSKAIIPAAGLGTRFFPATKTVPKEMLPIIDKPAILYVIEEAIQAGIEDIVLIQGRGKTAIEDFFDISYELEDKLMKDGKQDLLKEINYIRDNVNIISIRQKQALGLGHAVFCGQKVVGDEPFAVLLGDEITYSPDQSKNITFQLKQSYEQTQISTIAVMKVLAEEVHKYGVIAHEAVQPGVKNGLMKVTHLVEKPSQEKAPSLYALPGRYVFDGKIFSYIQNSQPGLNGEIQLTDAMVGLAKDHGLNAMESHSQRYDIGDKIGFLKANIEFALMRPELKDDMRALIKSLKI